MRAGRPSGFALLLGLAATSVGCQLFATIGILTAPRRIQKAEFQLSKGPLAIFIEAARPGEENPVFNEALHDKLVEIFREEGITTNIIPQERINRLRRQHPDFARWSLQRIGAELGARQLLYVRLKSLRLRSAPDHPLVQPQVRIRLKVIGVDESRDTARQWPGRSEKDGRLIVVGRPAREAGSAAVVDSEAVKLARDAAYHVAAPFHDVDLEENFPVEP